MIRDTIGDWQELSALYERADALGEAELSGWLEQLRGERHRLLAQLEKMLAARRHVATGDFLQSLPRLRAEPRAPEADWAEGSRIGAYRLIRHIGSGGMAEVWLAERADGAFERQVAIKLLFNQPTRSQRETFVERFRRERDILASLHHPHIAGLHDAGVTPSGQPWLALEYVQGEPITAWCDKKRLTLEERIKVFRQVLLAVEHAHANLIIHRDLKPSNILVTEQGEVKLLDFGIAKLIEAGHASTSDSDLTRESGRPLTLHYASPEQLRSEPLTTVSDVYSLGVVLYELLCGTRPFEDSVGPTARLQDALQSREAEPPSRQVLTDTAARARSTGAKALAKALAGDLDAVACKAMADVAARRYPSAEALRSDLDRWCEHRPVLAKPAGAIYRAQKFYRRHRLGVWSSAIALASVAGLGVSTVVAGLNAQRESVRAVASRDFVVELFRLADPENSRGRQVSPSDLLDGGRKRALESLASQPALQADVLRQIGVMQGYVGDYRRADENLRLAAAIFAREGRLGEWAGTQIELADNAFHLGDESRASLLIETVGARLDELSADTALLARYWALKGAVSRSMRELPRALDELSRAISLSATAFGENHGVTIDAVRELADVLSDLGRHEEALERMRDAAARAAGNPGIGQRDRFAIDLYSERAKVRAGRWMGSIDRLRELLSRCEAELGVADDHCVYTAGYIAWVALRVDDRSTQASVLDRLLTAAANEGSPWRQAGMANLATEILAVQGTLSTHPGVVAQLKKSAETETLPVRDRTQALLALAHASLRTGKPAEAESWAMRAFDSQSRFTNPDRELVARSTLLRGLSRHALSRHAEALLDIRAASSMLAASLGEGHALVALYRCNEAVVLRDLGRHDEAVRILDRSIAVLAPNVGNAPVVRRMQEFLARLRGGRDNSVADVIAPDVYL